MRSVYREKKLLACLLAQRARKPPKWKWLVRPVLFVGTITVLLGARYLVFAMPAKTLFVLGGAVMWGAVLGIGLLYTRQNQLWPLAQDYLDYQKIEARLKQIC